MRTAVAQPSAVYPLPTRASNAWQLMHLAAAISLPLPSGRFWLKAGNAEHSKAVAIMDRSNFLDMVSPLERTRGALQRVWGKGLGLLVFPPVKVLRSRTEVQRVRAAGYRLTLRAPLIARLYGLWRTDLALG